MKKIIAAAVATAFVAPAMAADVSVTGNVNNYLVNDEVVGSSSDALKTESDMKITATSEGNNGLSFKAVFNLDQEGTADGGEGVTVSSAAFGSVTIGNPSSAIDAVDDKTEILELMDPTSGNADSTVLWKLPTLVDGLSVNVSYAPTDGDNSGSNETNSLLAIDGNESDGDTANDESGVSFAYQMGPVRLAYGQNDEATEENTFVGLQYKANGIMVAYETNENKVTSTSVTTDHTSVAAMYTMGDASFRYLATGSKVAGADTVDRSAYGIHYNLGGGATLVVETGSEDAASSLGEFTGVGIKYSF